MWENSLLTWPNAAQVIQTAAEAVTGQTGAEMQAAAALLEARKSDANYSRHPLSVEAEALLGLRADLDILLNQGTVLTASPYQFEVGNIQPSGDYLNPQAAIKTLVNKLGDHVDQNRPTGNLYAVAILVSESQLKSFAATLNNLTAVFPMPDWCQVARQATALSTNAVDKLFQPAAIIQPRFKPQANINANPLRQLLKQQGSQLATLESLASDKTNVIDKLSLLATKRSAKLDAISAAINGLKSLPASVWSLQLSGTPLSIATQLNQASVPNNNQYTVASLMLSPQPLTFFGELLC
ncbi:MAG: hypothetical protein ACJAT7_002049 [Psychromonas sp.]|jgi:hypothetical protein|uniref:hypothetical protein n=1 Tax=Psychromonas sp. TaxID=1884585 RepID=UPI0039E43555